jgi:hypothetical protein
MTARGNNTNPESRMALASEEIVRSALPDLSSVSLRALGRCDDARFEAAVADIYQQINRQDSSVAGHNS